MGGTKGAGVGAEEGGVLIPPQDFDKAWAGLYALIPHIDCKKKCAAYCGPIALSGAEYRRLGSPPARGSVDDTFFLQPQNRKGECPVLQNGRCSRYANRPILCRLWGVVPAMPCPHGCRAERILTPDEARALLHEADRLSLQEQLSKMPPPGPGEEREP